MDNLRHTVVRAKDHDIIVLFVDRKMDETQMAALDEFVDDLSESTEATIVAFPSDVVEDCQNYTIQDLLRLRELIDSLIGDQIGTYPVAEA